MILRVEVSTEVAERLERQATALLLHRHQYLRAVLAAVAKQADALEHERQCPHCGAERRQQQRGGNGREMNS